MSYCMTENNTYIQKRQVRRIGDIRIIPGATDFDMHRTVCGSVETISHLKLPQTETLNLDSF